MPDINKEFEFIMAVLKTGSITVNYDAASTMLGWNKKKTMNKMSDFPRLFNISPGLTPLSTPASKLIFKDLHANFALSHKASSMTGPSTRKLLPLPRVRRPMLPNALPTTTTVKVKPGSEADADKPTTPKKPTVKRVKTKAAKEEGDVAGENEGEGPVKKPVKKAPAKPRAKGKKAAKEEVVIAEEEFAVEENGEEEVFDA
ncbi:hypothetical protein V8E51_007682 [Hyaloscypha variabilis]